MYNESTRLLPPLVRKSVQGLWTRERGEGSDKLHPLSTDDFVLFTNTFVPRAYSSPFLYRPLFFIPLSSPPSLSLSPPLTRFSLSHSLFHTFSLSISLFHVPTSSFRLSLALASSSINVSPSRSRSCLFLVCSPARSRADTLMFHRTFRLSINKCACYLHTVDSRKANIYTLDINTH